MCDMHMINVDTGGCGFATKHVLLQHKFHLKSFTPLKSSSTHTDTFSLSCKALSRPNMYHSALFMSFNYGRGSRNFDRTLFLEMGALYEGVCSRSLKRCISLTNCTSV